jgi:hypothetical protein
MNPLYCTLEVTCFANDNDALIPELWAREALAKLRGNLVMGALVNRDYSSEVKNFGDVVNTHRPADFSALRKTDADAVTDQDAESPNIPVPLDQHFHTSFMIKDGELSKALPDLLRTYMEPAAYSIAKAMDRVLCGQSVRLQTYTEGRLGEMSSSNADTFILAANTQLDINEVVGERYMVLGPRAQQQGLSVDLFVSANKRGDQGTALHTASLGTVYNLNSFMDQNMNWVDSALTDHKAGTVTGAEVAGETGSITVSILAYEVQVGDYVVVAGDGEAYEVSAATASTNTTAVTIYGGTKHAWGAGAVITAYKSAAVNLTAGYAAGWSKAIALDGFTSGKEMQVGQWISFGTGTSRHSYTVISTDNSTATESSVQLDRPLSAALTNNQVCFPGPAGGVNLVFVRDCMALVTRPLAQPSSEFGVKSAVAEYDGYALRVVMQYDSSKQGTRVTFDVLCGVAILNEKMGVLLYS